MRYCDFVSSSNLNDHDQIIGTYSDGTNNNKAFYWESGVMTNIAPLTVDTISRATDINNFGQVVGHSFGRTSAGFTDKTVYTWNQEDGAQIIDNLTSKTSSLIPRGINDSGQVVGDQNGGSADGAFVWSEAEGSKTFTELGVPSTTARIRTANAINNSGQIAGEAVFEGDRNRNMFSGKREVASLIKGDMLKFQTPLRRGFL